MTKSLNDFRCVLSLVNLYSKLHAAEYQMIHIKKTYINKVYLKHLSFAQNVSTCYLDLKVK